MSRLTTIAEPRGPMGERPWSMLARIAVASMSLLETIYVARNGNRLIASCRLRRVKARPTLDPDLVQTTAAPGVWIATYGCGLGHNRSPQACLASHSVHPISCK